MKIAIDISPISNNNSGHKVRGVGSYIRLLVDNLEKYDKENSYIFFDDAAKLSNDVNIVHYPYFEPFFLTLPFFKKYKTVVTVHDLTPLVFKNNFPVGVKGSIKWQIQKKSLKSVAAIITDSNSSKKDISKIIKIDESRIHTVYLAADKTFIRLESGNWKEKIIEKYNLPEKFLLYVGDVTWNKNLPKLVEAIKKTDFTLVMVGKALMDKSFDVSNSWNADLKKVLSEIEGNGQFLRLGFVSTEDLVKIYNLATVFIMPSLYEGFGLPVLEAMSCGCPVITAKAGSLPEVGGKAVFYIDPKDLGSIEEGIKKVFSDTELQKELSEKGLEQAKKFSIEKTIKETIEVYNLI